MNPIAFLLRCRRFWRAILASRTSALVLLAALVLVLPSAFPASAYWSATATWSAQAVTSTLGPPTHVTAVPSAAPGSVTVTWTASAGDPTPEGYVVTRSAHADGSAAVPACPPRPIELAPEPTCTDTAAPGDYYYTVTAVYRSWTSAGASSGIVTVSEPSTPIALGAATRYSVLAGTAVVNTLASTVSGDLGVSPGTSVSGFGPGTVAGEIHTGDAHATLAQDALGAALTELRASPLDARISGEIGGRTLTPGTYHSGAALAITGVLTLDAQGDAEAIFIFQIDAAFNTAAAGAVVLAGGAQASNVFWVVDGAAGTGANSMLSGNILATGAITLGIGSELIGRALSRGTVTLANNSIRFTTSPPPTLGIDGGPVDATRDTTPTISGTSNAIASSPVSVRIADQVHQTSVSAGGTWSVTADVVGAGTHHVEAKVRDAAGNGGTAQQSLTVEVSPPPIMLGSAGSYSVLAATGIVSTGTTYLSGDMGVFPGITVIGFPPGILAGSIHVGDPDSAQAQIDLDAAFLDGSKRAAHTEIIGDLGGRTMHTGVHHSTAALALTGTLTLDAQGDPEAVFLFQTDAAFNTAAGSTVILTNGAQASNVFWVATGAVGTGADSFLSGTVVTQGAITLGASTDLSGRALSRGTVTLAASSLTDAVPKPPPAAMRLVEPSPTLQPSSPPILPPSGESTPTISVAPSGEPSPSTPPSSEPAPNDPPSNEPSPTSDPPSDPGPEVDS